MSIEIKKKSINGGDLLPSIQKVELKKALALSTIITKIARDALDLFVEGQFAKFDAPVGDNSCKIRSIKIALLGTRLQDDLSFKKEIEELLEKLKSTIENIKSIKQTDKNQSLKDFRFKHNIEFDLSIDSAFLIEAYFLWSVKDKNSYDRTDFSILQNIGMISKTAAKDWIFQIKQQLSKRSVQFVRDTALKINGKRQLILQKMLSDPFTKIYEGRVVLPNLYSMEVLFKKALKEKLLLIFKTEDQVHLFHSNEKQTTFIPKKVEIEDLDHPAILIEGEITDKKTFENADLFNLLMERASQDPQYLEGIKAEEIPFENTDPIVIQEKEHFKDLNSENVPFKIYHISCEKVKNLLEAEA